MLDVVLPCLMKVYSERCPPAIWVNYSQHYRHTCPDLAEWSSSSSISAGFLLLIVSQHLAPKNGSSVCKLHWNCEPWKKSWASTKASFSARKQSFVLSFLTTLNVSILAYCPEAELLVLLTYCLQQSQHFCHAYVSDLSCQSLAR